MATGRKRVNDKGTDEIYRSGTRRPEKAPEGDWLALHKAILSGDATARSIVAERYLEYVKRTLKKKMPDVEDELITDAVTDAFVNYFLHPERFDPAKKSLPAYLVMSARGDLLNALEKKRNRERREVLTDDGELRVETRNDLYEGDAEELLKDAKAHFDPDDAEAVMLMAQDEKSYKLFAKVWKIDGADTQEMRRQVKRRKMQLKRKLVKIASGIEERKGSPGG